MDKNKGFVPCLMTLNVECTICFLKKILSLKLAKQQCNCNFPSDMGRMEKRAREKEEGLVEGGREEGRKREKQQLSLYMHQSYRKKTTDSIIMLKLKINKLKKNKYLALLGNIHKLNISPK